MAGSGNRDVALTISAKNEATKAIDSVAEALKTLAGIQEQVGESAANAEGLLGELAAELEKLSRQAKGLEALGVAAGAIDKASGAVERLQNNLARSKGENEGLASSFAEAGEATRALSAAAEKAKAELEAQRAIMAAVRAENKAGSAAVLAQRKIVQDASAAWKDLQAQVRAAAGNENALDSALSRSNTAIARQEAALEAASANLAEIQKMAAGASAALGGVAATQEAVGAASQRTASDIARVNAALAAQPAGAAGATAAGPAASATAAYRAQIDAVQQAREAFAAASAAATRLGAEMARAEAPTADLAREFTLAKANAAAAEAAFMQQARALDVLRGATQGSLSGFLASAEAGDRASEAARRQAEALERDRQALMATIAAEFQFAAGARETVIGLDLLAGAEAAAGVETHNLAINLGALFRALMTIPGAAGEAGEGLEHVASSGEHGLSIFTRMRNEILALTTAYVGFYGAISAVDGVIKTYQTLQSAQQRLAVAFDGDQNAVGQEIGFVREQSERLGIAFNTLATEYTRVAIAGKEAGYSVDGTRKIFLAFAEAGRVAGLSQQQLESAFLGLRESIERGTINARNFNLEIGQNVPGAVQAMAAALGVSTAKFTEMQKASGGVAATEDTLVKFADNLTSKFAGQLPAAVQTLNAEMGRFQSNMQQAQLAVADGGFAAGLTAALKELNAEFTNGAGESFFRNVGAAMGALAGVIPLVVNNFGLLVDTAEVFIGLKVAEALLNIARNGALFGVSFAEGAGYVTAMKTALAGLGGETGAIAVAMARLRVAVATTGQQIENMTLATAMLIAREGAAAVTTAALGASIVALDGLMTLAATVARAMWVAIGGFPGIIITGLTFVVTSLLGDWIGGIDSANDEMSEHASIMEKVRQAYADAAGDSKKFAENLKGLSTIQIEALRAKSQSDLGKARGGVSNTSTDYDPSGLGTKNKNTIASLAAITRAFQSASITASDFKARVNALAEADPALDRKLVKQLEDTADKGIAAETRIADFDATLRQIHGTATDADRALLGASQAVTKLNGAFDAAALDRYNTALLNLQKQVPGITSKIAEMQEKINKAQDDYRSGMTDLAGPLASKDPNVQAQAKAAAGALKDALTKAVSQIKLDAAFDEADEGAGQKFVNSARKYTGDSKTNRKGDLDALFKQTGTAFDQKWCADFLNAILALNGAPGTGSGQAKSFLTYGSAVPNQQAKPGDIVVVKTKDGYHVGIYTGPADNGRVNVIGGNQAGGKVNEKSFPASSVAAFRRAPTASEQEKAEEKRQTAQEEFDRSITALVNKIVADTAAQGKSPRDAFIASKLDEAQKRVDQSGPTADNPNAKKLTFTDQQKQAVTDAAGQEYDTSHQAEETKKVAAAQLELNTLRKNGAADLTREEYIHDEAIKDGVDLLDAQGQKYAALKGQIYDLTAQQKSYQNVVGLGEQLKTAESGLKDAFKRGNAGEVVKEQQAIASLVAQIKAALPAAEAFAKALGDQKMVEALDQVKSKLDGVKASLVDADQINEMLASGLTDAFGKSMDAIGKAVQGIGTWGNAIRGVANAFRQFAADFLKQIAEMIIKQQLMNLLSKTPIGGMIAGGVNAAATAGTQAAQQAAATTTGATIGTAMTTAGTTAALSISSQFTAAGQTVATMIAAAMSSGGGGGGGGSLFSSLLGGGAAGAGDAAAGASDAAAGTMDAALVVAHGGGVIGRSGMTRRGSPADFIDAIKMHGGGIAGLKSDEVATVLQRNEEVLTEDNPRHIFNQGKGGSSQPPQPNNVKVVNIFDAGEFVSQAMKTDVGEKAILNHVRNNRQAWGAALGMPSKP